MGYPFIPTGYHGGAQTAVSRIVIHATVSPCKPGGARNIAEYFRSPGAGGSAHYVIDPGEIVQCVKENVVAYHAPPNTGSIGIELCDPQAGPGSRWVDSGHEAMLVRAAALVREVAARWNVPLVKLGPKDLLAGKRGICGHIDVSNAWHKTDHGDPEEHGPFPWDHFMALIQETEMTPKETFDAVWNTDAIPSPGKDPKNPTWAPSSYLTDIDGKVRQLQTKVDSLSADIAAIKAAVVPKA
ncbi:MAG: hypothetical protein JWN52_7206 [Actinomycetia bacterium]|nr:hypothetical protein [Actinomycetes bacterium]